MADTTIALGARDEVAAGGVFTAMLLGMAISSLAIGRWGEAIGRRRSYIGLLAIMGIAGTVFALTGFVPALILAALTGTLSTDPNESGPITTVEQAMLASAPAAERSRVYGRYNAVAYLAGALGALAAGGPSALRDVLPAIPPDQRWLLLMPVGAAACGSGPSNPSASPTPAPTATPSPAAPVPTMNVRRFIRRKNETALWRARPHGRFVALDEPGIGEDPDVARHARLALPEDEGQLADRQLHDPQKRQDPHPRRVGKRLETIGKREARGHRLRI